MVPQFRCSANALEEIAEFAALKIILKLTLLLPACVEECSLEWLWTWLMASTQCNTARIFVVKPQVHRVILVTTVRM